MNVELNELEDWMLENACEDSGFVADLPGVAGRIYAGTESAESHRRALRAITRLVELRIIELGYERPGSNRSVPSENVQQLLASDEVWNRGAPSEHLLLYWATDDGIALNDAIQSEGSLRSSAVHASAWERGG